MSSRREFLTGTLVVASGMALGRAAPVLAGSGALPAGLIFTAKDPGMWAKKVGSHAPKVVVDGDQVTIETKHGMSNKHYIVRHTLVRADGKLVSAKTFYPTDDEPVSTHPLPPGAKGSFYATSFCNKHDFWVTEFTV